MRITRQTAQELVIEESTIWMAGVIFVAFLVFLCISIISGKTQMLYGAAVFLLGSCYFWRSETVVFDAGRATAVWTRRRFLSVATGSIPFRAINGIEIESTRGARGGITYRLTILSAQGRIPMSDSFGAPLARYESIRESIGDFMK